MNYDMPARDPQPRDPILVYDYNKQPGNNFKVYSSYQAPEAAAPCHNTLRGIGGWVCNRCPCATRQSVNGVASADAVKEL